MLTTSVAYQLLAFRNWIASHRHLLGTFGTTTLTGTRRRITSGVTPTLIATTTLRIGAATPTTGTPGIDSSESVIARSTRTQAPQGLGFLLFELKAQLPPYKLPAPADLGWVTFSFHESLFQGPRGHSADHLKKSKFTPLPEERVCETGFERRLVFNS